ncbi:DUF2382 domain-containing protein [Segetibacter aerophilus]|uniref:Photosystem reaction center subunit H n=1 Tax=Segetibacter aerophilus TaxID=670293 RepID=A0A512BJX5_9BACT|nr:PRC and DUF2382 domain-containing protein [Segetibacter aerophilus]GEO12273.1 hypothetical protein SAE01_47690 [Segetibacter aerophilus]
MSTNNENTNQRLQELGGSDFEIADGQPNIKGWDIKDETGKRIGEVDELLFDAQSRKVRYIVVDLEGNVLDLETRHVLVPIGIAQLHDKNDDVILPGVTAGHLQSLPEYKKDDVGIETENKVRNAFASLGAAGFGAAAITSNNFGKNEDFYNHEHFNEDNLYRNRNRLSNNLGNQTAGENTSNITSENTTLPVIEENLEVGKREVENGGVRLRSRIVEQKVSEDINLKQEKVTVERTPVDRPASEGDIHEKAIEMEAKEELPVTHKEARIVEEVSLNKEVTEREETISDTVRKTDVQVENLGSTDIDK